MSKRKSAKVAILMRPENVVQVTDNHGGYMVGVCLACGSSGWINGRFGIDSASPNAKIKRGTHIVHKPSCPMNRYAKRYRKKHGDDE